MKYCSYFDIISLWPSFEETENFHHSNKFCASISYNWSCGPGEGNFCWNLVNVFWYFVVISPCKRVWPFILTMLNFPNPDTLWAKFRWNWHIGSAEGKFTMTYNRYNYIWAFGSGELKNEDYLKESKYMYLCAYLMKFIG